RLRVAVGATVDASGQRAATPPRCPCRGGLANGHGTRPRLRFRAMGSAALPRLVGSRYVVPLREGGSLPAVVDTEADGRFVVKFRGAGQGPKALIAEALVAQIALHLQLPVPRPAILELDDGFGRGEPDPEIQDILRASV